MCLSISLSNKLKNSISCDAIDFAQQSDSFMGGKTDGGREIRNSFDDLAGRDLEAIEGNRQESHCAAIDCSCLG